jgi:predicted GH43/DUF377 family glycosyl hydrolase
MTTDVFPPPRQTVISKSEVPSFVDQAKNNGWKAAYFNFGKAEHPQCDYFNCGLVERPDGLWLMTRRSVWKDRLIFGMNDIVAFKLGGLDGLTPQIGYKVKFVNTNVNEQYEDPRAIYHNGRTYLACCNFVWYKVKKWTGAHQILAVTDDKWDVKMRYDPPYGKNGKGLGLNVGHEKNWVWFFHDNKLQMIYGAQPHTVVEFDSNVRFVTQRRTEKKLPWRFGEIRGGTPPVLVNGEYFTFFHSSLPWTSTYRRYYMGAYAFEGKPPFNITRITEEPLLTGSQNDYWVEKKPLVIFPCGSILRGQNWLVTFGVNDLKCGHVTIPFKDVTKRMTWLP